ncbi:MAG: T9SS type A sorting domain-containing protein [Bacteroidota bacterium]
MQFKFLYTFAVLLFGVNALFAQVICEPNTIYSDTIGVFPPPFEPETSPDGGITKAACIGEPYEFILTAVIGDTLNFGGAPIILDSLIILSVDGLPVGLQIGCNPGDCTVTMADTSACLSIFGTPDVSNAPGVYPLVLNARIFSGFLNLDLTFPNPAIAPGTYDLTLNAADACMTNVREFSSVGMDLVLSPNPMSGVGTMTVRVPEAGVYNYTVYNLLGQVVHSEQLLLQHGESTHTVEAHGLPKGVYLHLIQNDTKRISKRLSVQ